MKTRIRRFLHRSPLTLLLVLCVISALNIYSHIPPIPKKDRLNNKSVYLYKNGEFYLTTTALPRNYPNSDTAGEPAGGIDCEVFWYVNKPETNTRKIKRVIITSMESDSAIRLPERLYKQIEQLELYSYKQPPLPVDIGRFTNLRFLEVCYGSGESCGGFQRTDQEYAWRDGTLDSLKKLEGLRISGITIDPLQLKSDKLKRVEFACNTSSPYPLVKYISIESFILNHTFDYFLNSGNVEFNIIRYLANPVLQLQQTFKKVDSLLIDPDRWCFRYYSFKGNLIAETFTKEGKADSIWTYFAPDGITKQTVVEFANDSVVSCRKNVIAPSYMDTTRFEITESYFKNSRLTKRETCNSGSKRQYEKIWFDGGSTIVVRKFIATPRDSVSIEYYHGLERGKQLNPGDSLLLPFKQYFED